MIRFVSLLLAVQLAAASVIPAQKAGECSFTEVGDGGVFSSPNFPEDYSSNADCSWLIITGSNTMITLRFDSFLMENGPDRVVVYDGATTASAVIGNYTGFAVPQPTFSTSNVMLVVFTTNAVLNYAGFQARYESSMITTTTPVPTTTPGHSCGGVEIGSQVIQTPNFPVGYPDNANCIWYLQSNQASAIALEFTVFETEVKVDYVTVWEGWNPAESEPVATYSGLLATPFTYATTTSNRLTVRFVSDDTVNAPGFSALFR